MRYYLIVGEASGDLHASHLMRALKEQDTKAEFRFFGGDNMSAVGGTRVRHFKELAYMGFIPVLLHLPTIMRNMKMCKQDITEWNPDVVILVDYAGFNLSIAHYLKQHTNIPAFYYIAPKLWAWKEYRIKNIKRDVSQLFSILPFEKEFFENKHHYPIHYVGNPTADEVRQFRLNYNQSKTDYIHDKGLESDKHIIALLPGSRRQEIKDNLPAMLEASESFTDCQRVLACTPAIDAEYYEQFIGKHKVKMVWNETFPLLANADMALVTSGTATLETACFNVPQVVCYKTPVPHIIRWAFNHIIKCDYISLVNLIGDREIVPELFAERFSVADIRNELKRIMPGAEGRERMLNDYAEVHERLGNIPAPDNCARGIIECLNTTS